MREEEADTRSGGTGLLAAGVVIAAVIAAGLYLSLGPGNAPSEEDLAAIVAPDTSVPGDAAQPAGAPPAESSPAAVASVAPSIDEVRLEEDGVAVIAGRAAPGADVSVLVDGEEVATAVADARGAFAAIGFVAPSEDAQVLTLQAEGSGGPVASVEEVILAPLPQDPQSAQATPAPVGQGADDLAVPEIADDPLAEDPLAQEGAEPAPQTPAVSDDVPVVAEAEGLPDTEDTATLSGTQEIAQGTAETPGTRSDLPKDAPAQAGEQSVAVLKSTPDGVTLLQKAPEASSRVAIDTIGYSDTGDVQLSGRAAAGTSEVRIYLDNRFTAAFPVDSAGDWRGSIPEVAAGIYRLRADEVNVAGDVTSRLETPFKREAPAVLADASAQQGGPVRAVTVQTGDTLWAIARDRYGEGLFYLRVFDANRSDIRDPDLIYPGQVFDLPVE